MKALHPIAGAGALLVIATFWLATLASEASGSVEAIVAVKTAIPWGFLLLVPLMMAAGGSGFAQARGRRGGLVAAKGRRMRVIALNGIFVLIPAALFLASAARIHAFGTGFVAVQTIELAAGLVNISLMGLNMRDGLRMAGRLPRRIA